MLLIDTVEWYLQGKDVSKKYRKDLRRFASELVAWAGVPLDIADLNDPLVNRFLLAAQDSGQYAPRTLRHRRNSIVTLWRSAWEEGLTETPPRRIRRIKVPRPRPRGYKTDQMDRWIDACRKLRGCVRRVHEGRIVATKIPRSLALEGILQGCWCTGIRLGDCLTVTREWLEPDGSVWVLQSKTGVPLLRHLTPRALAVVNELHRLAVSDPLCEDVADRIVPFPASRVSVDRWLARTRERAGLPAGLTREIRRGSSSYVDRDDPGRGGEFLGQLTPGLFRLHYEDLTITQNAAVLRPPAIGTSPPPLLDAS